MRWAGIIGRELRMHLRSTIGWTMGVVAIVVIQLSVYPTVESSAGDWSRVIDEFPEPLREILRITDYTSEQGYLSAELMSFILPFVVMGFGARWGARVATQDEELGLADIILGLPLSRSGYLSARLGAAVLAVSIPVVAFMLSLVVGGRILEFSVPIERYMAGSVVLFGLGVMTMAIASAVGCVTGKRSAALGVSMALVVALFILYSLAPLVPAFESILPWNPMQWTLGSSPLINGISWSGLAWLVLVCCVLLVTSFISFGSRDVDI